MRNNHQQYGISRLQSPRCAALFLLMILMICNMIACASMSSGVTPSALSTLTIATSVPDFAVGAPPTRPLAISWPRSSSPLNTEIYLAITPLEFVTGEEYVQIWRIGVDSSSERLIYQSPKRLSIAGTDMLLPETVREIQEHFRKDESYPNPVFPNMESLTVSVALDHLALSPDRRLLAWVEHYTWCPGNYCYGESRIKVLEMDSSNLVIDRRAKLWVTSLDWIPDGQGLVFSEMFQEDLIGNIYHLQQLDLSSGEIRFIGSGDSPAISPDGQVIVTLNQNTYGMVGLDRITLNDHSRQTVLSPTWVSMSTPAWSPDGSRIAFSGRRADAVEAWGMSIYILELQTQKVVTLTAGIDLQVFYNPQWSPDGSQIAVNAGDSFGDWKHLLVLDSWSGQILAGFAERRNALPLWEWANDGQYIVFPKGFLPEMQQEIAIFHITTERVITIPIPEIIQDRYYKGKLYLSDITW